MRGLRGRLLLALLATAAVTLGVAALALLSPLRERLREADADAVRQAALLTRPQLETLLEREGGIGSRVTDLVFDLQERTGARVLLIPAEPIDLDRALDTGSSPTRYDDVFQVAGQVRTFESDTAEGTRIAVPLRTDDRFSHVLALRRASDEAGSAFTTVRDAFLTAGALSLLVALMVGFALSGALVRRLERLRATALRLAAQGPDAPEPEDKGLDEIGDLSRAFGAMQRALRRQEEARRQFVATASHELRTPITSLSGNLELLAEDLDSGRVDLEDAREQIAGAQGELRRLTSLATELLEVSRLDAGVALHPEPVELGELGRAVAAEFALRAGELGVALDVVEPRAPVWARADPGAAARVARILLDNALRFAPAGTAVRVVAGYRGERAILEVRDRGPGVPPAERDAIFERFRRGSSTGGEGGFGLGLAIGRELAERMAGALRLAPSAEGARFELDLPIEQPQDV
jgi:signal transduction histidine kinase